MHAPHVDLGSITTRRLNTQVGQVAAVPPHCAVGHITCPPLGASIPCRTSRVEVCGTLPLARQETAPCVAAFASAAALLSPLPAPSATLELESALLKVRSLSPCAA